VTRPHRRVRPACHFGRQAGTRDQGWQVELEPDARQVRLALQLEPLVETLSGAQHGWPMPPHDWQVPAVTWLEQNVFGAVQTL
jgi:hypothetical protein